MNVNSIAIAIVVCGAGCGSLEASQPTIEISQPNALGAVSIAVDRFETNGDSIVELRGLNSAGDEVATVRKRVGTIADLPDYLPSPATFGAEIVITAAGDQVRMISHEVTLNQLDPVADSTIQGFLELSAVRSALAQEANIVIASARQPQPGEQDYQYSGCSPAQLNVSPVANQCCYYAFEVVVPCVPTAWGCLGGGDTYGNASVHVNPSNAPKNASAEIYRQHNPSGAACKAADGTYCAGSSCYYGPNGFAMPVVTTPQVGSPYFLVHPQVVSGGDTMCLASAYVTPQTPDFANVTGTFPTGQGCPGSDGGSGAGLWDY